MVSLLDSIVSRIRTANTVFGDRVTKTTTMQLGEQYTKKIKPNLLVAPIYENVMYDKKIIEPSQVHDEIIRMRGFSFAGYFDPSEDLRSTDFDLYEQATEQLISLLVNWVPDLGKNVFGPGYYESMRVVAGSQTESVFVWNFGFPMNMSVDCLNNSENLDLFSEAVTSYSPFGVSPKTKIK